MMENKQLVSVIIPVYNSEKYLAEAIESVLAQTYCPTEVIVVDDGSTDRTPEVAKQFSKKIRYYYQKNGGIGVARNTGVDVATGQFLAFLDSDDLWLKDKLMRQMAIFDVDPKLDMVFGHVEQFYSPELGENEKRHIRPSAEVMPGYLAGAMLIKREPFLRAGPFETIWRVGEFIDWYLKAVEQGLKSFMLSEIVLRRRLHITNTVIRERKSQTDYVRILKSSLDRRRNVKGQYE